MCVDAAAVLIVSVVRWRALCGFAGLIKPAARSHASLSFSLVRFARSGLKVFGRCAISKFASCDFRSGKLLRVTLRLTEMELTVCKTCGSFEKLDMALAALSLKERRELLLFALISEASPGETLEVVSQEVKDAWQAVAFLGTDRRRLHK